MVLNIKTKNLELTPSIKEYIENKILPLANFVKRWEEEGSVEADFELARSTQHHHKGMVYYAEVNLSLGGDLLRAGHEGEDIYEVVDKVKDKIKKELLVFKERAEKKRGD